MYELETVANAFYFAHKLRNASKNERDKMREMLGDLNIPTIIEWYMDIHSSDRRYKVKWHAATTNYTSAIVTYRRVKMHVIGKWNPTSSDGYIRGFYTFTCERTS